MDARIVPTGAALALVTLLAGCAGTLPSIAESGGCQVRAGAVIPEGGSGLSGYAGIGGAATIVGTCPTDFRVLTRHDGSLVCYGEADWCASALREAPIAMTPSQLRSLVAPGQ